MHYSLHCARRSTNGTKVRQRLRVFQYRHCTDRRPENSFGVWPAVGRIGFGTTRTRRLGYRETPAIPPSGQLRINTDTDRPWRLLGADTPWEPSGFTQGHFAKVAAPTMNTLLLSATCVVPDAKAN
jgi:hypothetical protein